MNQTPIVANTITRAAKIANRRNLKPGQWIFIGTLESFNRLPTGSGFVVDDRMSPELTTAVADRMEREIMELIDGFAQKKKSERSRPRSGPQTSS